MVTKEELIEQVFKKYVDPELGIDVWTLGLIYTIDIKNKKVKVVLTFTSMMCPFGPQMVEELTEEIKKLGVEEVEIEVTFQPPWKPSEELRGMMGVWVVMESYYFFALGLSKVRSEASFQFFVFMGLA